MDWPRAVFDAQLIVRLSALVLAGDTMVWTAGLTLALARGDRSLRALYRSVLFFLAAGTVSFQVFAIFGTPTVATRIGSTFLLLIGFALCRCVKRLTPRYDQLHRALDHIGEAMAIVDLARVDLTAAREMAEQCRRITAESMMARG